MERHFSFFLFNVYMCAHMCVQHMWKSELDSFLIQCVFRELNSSHEVWWQVPFSCWDIFPDLHFSYWRKKNLILMQNSINNNGEFSWKIRSPYLSVLVVVRSLRTTERKGAMWFPEYNTQESRFPLKGNLGKDAVSLPSERRMSHGWIRLCFPLESNPTLAGKVTSVRKCWLTYKQPGMDPSTWKHNDVKIVIAFKAQTSN